MSEVSPTELEAGESRVMMVDGQEVALFNAEGRLYAVANRCPHRGGPLSRGRLEGTSVRCPIHGWRFDLATGQCLNQPQARICAYSVSLDQGQLSLKPIQPS